MGPDTHVQDALDYDRIEAFKAARRKAGAAKETLGARTCLQSIWSNPRFPHLIRSEPGEGTWRGAASGPFPLRN